MGLFSKVRRAFTLAQGFIPWRNPVKRAYRSVKHVYKQVAERVDSYRKADVRERIQKEIADRIRVALNSVRTWARSAVHFVSEMASQITSYIMQKASFKLSKFTIPQSIDNLIKSQITQKIGWFRSSRGGVIPQNKEIPISDFCKLDLVGKIMSIECFQEMSHEFLLVHTMGIYPHCPTDQPAWIRLERGLQGENKSDVRQYWKLFRGKKFGRKDTAIISFNRARLTTLDVLPAQELKFKDEVTLRHLVVLLERMETKAAQYHLYEDNCWVFCQTVLDCMELLQGKRVVIRRSSIKKEHRLELKRWFKAEMQKKFPSARVYGSSNEM